LALKNELFEIDFHAAVENAGLNSQLVEQLFYIAIKILYSGPQRLLETLTEQSLFFPV
jgi:hypothetical protein